MNIETIREKIINGRYIVSFTHTEKIRLRKIELEEIEQAVCTAGEIIEAYPDDPRGPCCLIFGHTNKRRPLHVVCGNIDNDEILIITAYEPDLDEWEANLKIRKKGV